MLQNSFSTETSSFPQKADAVERVFSKMVEIFANAQLHSQHWSVSTYSFSLSCPLSHVFDTLTFKIFTNY